MSQNLEENLRLEQVGVNLYRNTNRLWHPIPTNRIYGGALVAQALSAALETVPEDLRVHSLHSSFVNAYFRSNSIHN